MPEERAASGETPTTATNVGENTGLRCTTMSDVDTRWSVAIAAGFIAFFGVASMSNLGFFYVYFLEEFHTNRENASWPGSVLQIMGHVAGIIVAVLQRFLSTFYIGLLGSVVLWAGLLFAVLSPNIAWMTVTFGFVHGAGVGIIMVTVIVSIMSHFQKYRGLAAGFKYTGNTLASLLLPKVLSSLQDLYTFRGTLLIYAAISMHCTAFTLFLKERQSRQTSVPPVSSKEQNSERGVSSAHCQGAFETALKNEKAGKPELTNAGKNTLNRSSDVTCPAVGLNGVASLHTKDKQIQSSGAPKKILVGAAVQYRDSDVRLGSDIRNTFSKHEHFGAISHTEKPKLQSEVVAKEICSLRINEFDQASHGYQIPKIDDEKKPIRDGGRRSGAAEHSYGILNTNAEHPPLEEHSSHPSPTASNMCHSSNLRLFASPTFYVLVLGAIAADFTTVIVHATIVDYALDKGVARKSAEMSMTYCSSTELVGRLLLPLAADLGFVSRTNLVAMCFTAMAATSLALPHTASFASYIPVQVATALFLACVATLKGVLVADSFGPHAVPTFWGANGIALIPVLLGNPFITGYFRDTTGSYDNLFGLLAGVQLFTAVVFYILACFKTQTRSPS